MEITEISTFCGKSPKKQYSHKAGGGGRRADHHKPSATSHHHHHQSTRPPPATSHHHQSTCPGLRPVHQPSLATSHQPPPPQSGIRRPWDVAPSPLQSLMVIHLTSHICMLLPPSPGDDGAQRTAPTWGKLPPSPRKVTQYFGTISGPFRDHFGTRSKILYIEELA